MKLTKERCSYLFDKYVDDFFSKDFNPANLTELTSEECLYVTTAIIRIATIILNGCSEPEKTRAARVMEAKLHQWKVYSFQKLVEEGFYVLTTEATKLPAVLSGFKIYAYTDLEDAKHEAREYNNSIPAIDCNITQIGEREEAIAFLHAMVNNYGFDSISFNENISFDKNGNVLPPVLYSKDFIDMVCVADDAYFELINRNLCKLSLIVGQESYRSAKLDGSTMSEEDFHLMITNFNIEVLNSKLVIPTYSNGDGNNIITVTLENGLEIIPVFSSKGNMLRVIKPPVKCIEISGAKLLESHFEIPMILDFNTVRLPILKESLISAVAEIATRKKRNFF